MRRDDFKSDEEYWFYLWLLEAVEYDFVHSFAYEPRKFCISENKTVKREILMKTKRKSEDARLFENHGKDGSDQYYTPDFIFNLTHKGKVYFGDNVFWQTCQHQKGAYSTVHVDVKGTFNPYTSGSNAVFWLKQRLMWDVNGVYVHKISLSRNGGWFSRTWAPELLRWMKNRKEPTKTKLGGNTLNSKEYTHKFAWKMSASSTLNL
jgi:hypothetical protein